MSQINNIIIQVRSLLRERSIKLWLEPYYFKGIGSCDVEMENLAKDFHKTLSIPYDYCLAAMNELQSSALDKLKAREECQNTGMASVNVQAVIQQGNTNTFNIQVPLEDLGKILYSMVSKQIAIDVNRIKLISSGKVIDSEKTLSGQGIVNNQKIMALVMQNNADAQEKANIYDKVNKTKSDAALLVESSDHTFLRMEDQDGNAVHLPPSEKKMILMALALHEKGRSALKKEQFNEALVLFLEADEQFTSCSSHILETVDNYALLNLDIVWCYLCLKSMTYLPDAERRLQLCEKNFKRSYGENMDRVILLKGGSQNEKALVMRLHLLQAVVMFHKNQKNMSRNLLTIAESELNCLKVNETSLQTMIDMGYSTAETRTALRSCAGNIEQAVGFIAERRAKKKEARKKADKEHAINRRNRNDDADAWVNPRTVQTLVDMGFEQPIAFEALRKSDNDVEAAIDMLQNESDKLLIEFARRKTKNVDENLVENMVKLGFNPEMAKVALDYAVNNSEQAIDMILKLQRSGRYEAVLGAIESVSSNISAGPSTSAQSSNIASSGISVKDKVRSEMEALQAYNRFSKDINNEDDEYLDLSLEQEEHFLLMYKDLLNE